MVNVFFLLLFYFTSRLWENPSRSKFKNNAVICLSFQMFVKTVTTSSPGTNTHSLLSMNIRQVALSSPNRSRFTLWICYFTGLFLCCPGVHYALHAVWKGGGLHQRFTRRPQTVCAALLDLKRNLRFLGFMWCWLLI